MMQVKVLIQLLKQQWSIVFLILWLIVALLAPILANEKTLIRVDDNGYHLPFLSDKIEYSGEAKSQINALIPYSPSSIDFNNANSVSPFDEQSISSNRYRHWLGTDKLGRDVLANLIHGSSTALIIGIGAMLIASLIGLLFGSIAAYFGDNRLQIKLHQLVLAGTLFILFLFGNFVLIPWDIEIISSQKKLIYFAALILLIALIYWGLNKILSAVISSKHISINLPLDLIVGRLIEIMEAIPILFLLIALSAVLKPSMLTVIIIIGLGAWPSIAKFSRAEILKIRNTAYIENSKALGLKNRQVLLKHILPNAAGPILLTLAFGLAASILLESTLSFLGFGISSDTASWGQLLSSARQNYEAWWLAIFPGLAIFTSIIACNSMGDQISD